MHIDGNESSLGDHDDPFADKYEVSSRSIEANHHAPLIEINEVNPDLDVEKESLYPGNMGPNDSNVSFQNEDTVSEVKRNDSSLPEKDELFPSPSKTQYTHSEPSTYASQMNDNESNDKENIFKAPENSVLPEYSDPPVLPVRSYNFQNSSVFKTSERILDDIRHDPFFVNSLLDFGSEDDLSGTAFSINKRSGSDEGILNQETIDYSERLIGFAKKNPLQKYEIISLNLSPTNMNYESQIELPHDDNKQMWIFKFLVVPKNVQGSFPPSSRPIYHLTIKIKGKPDLNKVLHQFYYFDDDNLFTEDYNDLISSEEEDDDPAMDKFFPRYVDSANFICKYTKTIMRVELMKPIFTTRDLNTFEKDAIELRYSTFMSKVSDDQTLQNLMNNVKVPTVIDCLYTLLKVLRGPLNVANEGKSIKPNTNVDLMVQLDLDILTDTLYFTLNELDEPEYTPPIFDTESKKKIGYNFFWRAMLEVMYYGSYVFTDRSSSTWVTATRGEDIFKNKISFTNKLDKVWNCLNEPYLTAQSELWNKWHESNFYYDNSFTLLSCLPYYSEDDIIKNYETLSNINQDFIPEYFDALKHIATTNTTFTRLQIYVSKLSSHGIIGFKELKSCYSDFQLDITKKDVAANLTDDTLISAYKDFIAIASSLQEKKMLRESLTKIAAYTKSLQLKSYLDTEKMFDVNEAYSTLEVDPSVDDDIMITAYQLKAEESRYYNSLYARALMTIASTRKSFMLLEYIDQNLPMFFQKLNTVSSKDQPQQQTIDNDTVNECYKIVGCDAYADDYQIVRIVQERINKESSSQFAFTWKALKVIGSVRNSKLIEGFMGSGIIDSRLLSTDSTPAGLNNIGNTCYLNSLLQYYFVIEPLRSEVLKFNRIFDESEEDFNNKEYYKNRRIGGRNVSFQETERSYQFMYQLRNLFDNMIHLDMSCVEPSRELAYLAFAPSTDPIEFEVEDEEKNSKKNIEGTTVETENLQPLIEDPNILKPSTEQANSENDDVIMSGTTPPPSFSDATKYDDNNDSNSASLMDTDLISDSTKNANENVVAPLLPEKKKSVAKVAKISTDQLENALELGRQQDVIECIENVLFQIESALGPTELDEENEQNDLVKQLFYGKTSQKLTPIDALTKEDTKNGKSRSKIERFLNLIVNIGDHPKDIYDALDTYFTEDLVKLDDGEYKRSLTITELPKFLQIQIQRVQFDRERFVPVKSIEPLPFEESLYMDRYMETDDEDLIKKRKEVFLWKHKINELNNRKELLNNRNDHGLTLRESLVASKEFLSTETVEEFGLIVDPNTIKVIDEQINLIDEELKSINEEIQILLNKIANQYNNVEFNKIRYTIFAIFIHRGQASYGHYWIYIRDPKSNIYRKYNDEIVSEVSIEEVMNFKEGNTATPYYLVFVREDSIDSVQPLKREIIRELQ